MSTVYSHLIRLVFRLDSRKANIMADENKVSIWRHFAIGLGFSLLLWGGVIVALMV